MLQALPKYPQRPSPPKDKISRDDTSSCVYKIDCNNCDGCYVGETGRNFSYRLQEHIDDVEDHEAGGVNTRTSRASVSKEQHKSAITDHMAEHNHVPNWKDASILTKEHNERKRKIKEAIWIRRHPNNINRYNGAQYKLSRVYDNIIRQTTTPPPQSVPRGRAAKGGARI